VWLREAPVHGGKQVSGRRHRGQAADQRHGLTELLQLTAAGGATRKMLVHLAGAIGVQAPVEVLAQPLVYPFTPHINPSRLSSSLTLDLARQSRDLTVPSEQPVARAISS
jgi:hypothetical protein